MSTSDTLTAPQAFDSPMTPYAGGHSGSRTLPSFTGPEPEVDPWDAALGVPPERPAPPDLLDDGIALRSPFSPQTIPSISHTLASPDGSNASTDVERTCCILFPSLHRFRLKGFLGKIASLFAAPAVMVLTLMLPVVVMPYGSDVNQEEKRKQHYHAGYDTPLVDLEEVVVERTLMAEEAIREDLYEMKYNKCLMPAQCVLGPLFCVLFTIGGMAIGLLVVVFSDEKAYPTAQMARCSIGFLVAIVWIMAIADEVNVLQTFDFIFDLVANRTVTSFAPIMGFSIYFGGPLVDILLGVGMSGSYIISTSGHACSLQFTPTLMSSTLGLVLLLATLVVVPLNGYFLSRRHIPHVLLMVVNLVVELSHTPTSPASASPAHFSSFGRRHSLVSAPDL
ncbi:hypothetical protein ID866_10048 [Astraeus odoratus]|nr:hypothetical protein ID866_10048 [Astraeus odoratus]